MECSTIQDRIHELLDQRRRPGSDAAVVEHCRSCPQCAERLRLLEQLEATMAALPRPEPPPDLPRRILQQVAESLGPSAEPAGRSAEKRRWDGFILAAVVALGLLAMLAVDSFWPLPQRPDFRPVAQKARPAPLPPPVSLPPVKRQLQQQIETLVAETQFDMQQAQALLPETQSVAVPAPPVGADVLSPVAELVRPLQPVASKTFSTLGTFLSRVADSPPSGASASPADPG